MKIDEIDMEVTGPTCSKHRTGCWAVPPPPSCSNAFLQPWIFKYCSLLEKVTAQTAGDVSFFTRV